VFKVNAFFVLRLEVINLPLILSRDEQIIAKKEFIRISIVSLTGAVLADCH